MHVLVLQQDKSLKLGLAHLVRSFGFSTETASSLKEATDRLLPDVVIVDQQTTIDIGLKTLRSVWVNNNPEIMLITDRDGDMNNSCQEVDQSSRFTHPLDADLLEDHLGKIGKPHLTGLAHRGVNHLTQDLSSLEQ